MSRRRDNNSFHASANDLGLEVGFGDGRGVSVGLGFGVGLGFDVEIGVVGFVGFFPFGQ